MAAINPRNKQRQRALDDALQVRLSARFERRLRTEIAKTMREVAADYEKRGELAIPLAISEHSAGIQRTLEADYRLVAMHFGKRLLNEAKGFAGPDVIKESLTERLSLAVGGFIGRWIATKVTQINRTTENQIRRIIRGGIDEGLSVSAIGSNIRTMAAPMSALRANIIARTETHTAANYGAQQAAELTGLDMKREWVSSMDDRTRDTSEADHVAADGQIVGMKEPFTVSGERLMFPGDPSGSAANVINCFTGNTLVGAKSIKKSIKSLYSGKLITIKTKAGHQLTGTPNHPIMTDIGFLPLGEVDKLTNLVCCPIDVNFSNALDVEHIHSSFEQIHNSAKVNGVAMGIGAVNVNLYGRVPNGNVEVVNADSKLLCNVKPTILQSISKFKFKMSNLASSSLLAARAFFQHSFTLVRWNFIGGGMSGSNLPSPSLVRHRSPFKFFAFALTSSFNACFGNGISNNSSGNTKPSSNAVFAFASNVSGNDQARKGNVFSASGSNTITKQNLINGGFGNTNTSSYFRGGISDSVHLDNVVSINVFDCHNEPVYTLETEEGIYNAGGIISSNCRCAVVFIYD